MTFIHLKQSDRVIDMIDSVLRRKERHPAAQLRDLDTKAKGGRVRQAYVVSIAELLVICDDDRHRPGDLGPPELPPSVAIAAEQTHVGPARIGDGDSACFHRPSEQPHDVAGSRPGGRDHRIALARYSRHG